MSIRLRLALAFAAAAAVLFGAGAWLFAATLSGAQLRAIDSQLTAQLTQAARYLPGPAQPGKSVVPGEYLVQAIDPAGRVRGSPDAGTAPLVSPGQLGEARQSQVWATRTVDEEDMRVTAGPLPGRPGWVVVAAISLEAYDATQSQVGRGLVIGGLAVTGIAGLGAYWLARAALSPVERLRRQAAAISGHGDEGVLDVPRTKDEIAALAGTMNDLLSRLRQALERERALVADASHELRSPLAVLRGELELAGRPGRRAEELTDAVRTAAEEADRLARITDDLMVLARGDAGRLELQLKETDVAALLSHCAALTRSRLATAAVTCHTDVPAGTQARVDPDRIGQAVDNLLANATRFAPPGSVIVLAAREAGPDLCIEVRDDGPGFPQAFLPHAFERFRRPDGGRSRDDGGAGLGLAIVAAICTAHGGRAAAFNKPGGGAVVSLRLPSAVLTRSAPRRQVPGERGPAGDDDGQPAGAEGQAADHVGRPVDAQVDTGDTDEGGQHRRRRPGRDPARP
jgi:signal transduction histidine kinase